MLKNNGSGWATLSHGYFQYPVSYITEAPIDILHACINYLKYGCGEANFDGEPETTTLVIQDAPSYIIHFGDRCTVSELIVSPTYLISEIIDDIEEETPRKWAESFAIYCEDEAEEYIREYEDRLVNNLNEVKRLFEEFKVKGRAVE